MTSAPDQLVVLLSRLVELLNHLHDWKVPTEDEIEKHDGLGLALVTLARGWSTDPEFGIDDLARKLQGALQDEEAVGRNRFSGPGVPAGYLALTPVASLHALDKIPHAVGDPILFEGTEADWQSRLFSPEAARAAAARPGDGVRIGIIDTPLRRPPELAEPYTADPAPTVVSGTVDRLAGHSLFVAGLIRQHAPAAELLIRAVPGLENGATSTWETAKKMMSFADEGIDILNVSLGAQGEDPAPLELTTAVRLLSRQMLIVAAAGNYEDPHVAATLKTWPAAVDEVVAVGAVNGSGKPAGFSPQTPWVDYTAPGVNLAAPYLDAMVSVVPSLAKEKEKRLENFVASGRPAEDRSSAAALAEVSVKLLDPVPTKFAGKALWSGTSFAAATASGVIAAELSAQRRTVPEATARDALDGLDPTGILQPFSPS
jgi:subtilisin family serine protease